MFSDKNWARRVAIEILSPPIIATFLIITDGRNPDTILARVIGFPVGLFYGYLFGIIPSALYAAILELWIAIKGHQKCGAVVTILISSLLGLLSGYFVFLLSHHLTQGSSQDLNYLSGIGLQTGVGAGFLVIWYLQCETKPLPGATTSDSAPADQDKPKGGQTSMHLRSIRDIR